LYVVAHVESPNHVCCRYRLTALSPFLARGGLTLELRSLTTPWWQRLLTSAPAQGDACVLQRRLPSAFEFQRLRRACPTMIFDFDDAVWLRDSYSPKGLQSHRRLRRFRRVLSQSDRVVAGNRFLAGMAAKFTDATRVHVIPTCLDPWKYALAAHANNGPIELVWIGSSSTLQGLKRIVSTLEGIGLAIPRARLKLVCDSGFSLDVLPVEQRPWSEATEARELALADVGIAWMPDDDWSRGKCGLKILQYMAAGLPVIANPVGVHLEMIEHGVNGFLVETAEEWVEAVRTLARHRGLRQEMGLAGRRLVERKFDVALAGQKWLDLFDGMQPARLAA
jgi:glycosyltransferase involved in cell wall biosynthesis